jgi:hypothetical protein
VCPDSQPKLQLRFSLHVVSAHQSLWDLQQTSFACTVTCRHDFVAAMQPTDIRSTENPHHWIMWQPHASTLSCHSNSYYITFFSVLQAFYMIFRQNKAKRIVNIIFVDIY